MSISEERIGHTGHASRRIVARRRGSFPCDHGIRREGLSSSVPPPQPETRRTEGKRDLPFSEMRCNISKILTLTPRSVSLACGEGRDEVKRRRYE